LAKLLLRALLPGSNDPKIRPTRPSTLELRFSDCERWRLDFGFDILVQAKEIRRVVLLLDRHEPFVVGTVGSFDRVFSLFTQEIQTYAPLEKGRIESARLRAHSTWRGDSPGSVHCATMTREYWAWRWAKAVSETPILLAAPP
jgi:hypothetical protein